MKTNTTNLSNKDNLAFEFFEHLQKSPDRVALWVEERAWSYKELSLPVCQLASWLNQSFAGRGNIFIGILATRKAEAYIGLLASLWAGFTTVPLNIKLPTAYLKTIINQAELNCIIADPEHISRLIDVLPNLAIPIVSPLKSVTIKTTLNIIEPKTIASTPPLPEPVPVSPDNFADLLFTSGTTGTPKGIATTVYNMRSNLLAARVRYKFAPTDRFSQFNDLPWDPAYFDLLSAWGVGASAYVIPPKLMFAPASFIRKHQLTVWHSGAVLISLLSRMKLLKKGCFPSLRISLFMGEPLLADHVASWEKAAPLTVIENVYAPSELSGYCLSHSYESKSKSVTPQRDHVALGTPLLNMHVAIVDSNKIFLDTEQIGEIAVSGPQVTPGYWKNPTLTKEKFLKLNHPTLGSTRWYLTGDQGYQDASGVFHILGRIDNQVQINGVRLELEEVEYFLRKASKVVDVAVVGWPIESGLVHGLVAFIETQQLSTNEVKLRMLKLVPKHMIPQRLITMGQLPRNHNGKIDRKMLLDILRKKS